MKKRAGEGDKDFKEKAEKPLSQFTRRLKLNQPNLLTNQLCIH